MGSLAAMSNVRRSIFLALAAFLILDTASAQPASGKGTNHCLWKVQGASNTVYIFGSIHFLNKSFYPLPKPIEDAYEKSSIAVFEVDFDEMKSPAAQLKMAQQGQYKDGESLKKRLSKETYDKLHAHVAQKFGDGAAFDSLKPWMVAVTLLALELQKLGFAPEQGVDQYFVNKAKKDKKQILPLETVDAQLSLFASLTREEEEAMIQESMTETSKFQKIFNDVIEAWRTGNTKELDTFIVESMRDHPKLHRKLLIERNEQWTAQIERLLAGPKDVFVVVGAAHLVGKDSLIDLLLKKRYKVQQL